MGRGCCGWLLPGVGVAMALQEASISALCSLLEATLYSTRVAILEAARSDGRHLVAAGHMLDLKRSVSKPTSAILILNTIANTAAPPWPACSRHRFGGGARSRYSPRF